jgi:hypothetical protein
MTASRTRLGLLCHGGIRRIEQEMTDVGLFQQAVSEEMQELVDRAMELAVTKCPFEKDWTELKRCLTLIKDGLEAFQAPKSAPWIKGTDSTGKRAKYVARIRRRLKRGAAKGELLFATPSRSRSRSPSKVESRSPSASARSPSHSPKPAAGLEVPIIPLPGEGAHTGTHGVQSLLGLFEAEAGTQSPLYGGAASKGRPSPPAKNFPAVPPPPPSSRSGTRTGPEPLTRTVAKPPVRW